MSEYNEPEAELLWQVLQREPLVARLASAVGGWRSLGEHELHALELAPQELKAVRALQELVSRSYPELPKDKFVSSADIAGVYQHRLGGLVHEVMIAVGLDGRNNFIGEVEVGRGGAHGMAITARDILRPVIRMGASAFVLVHNHPSASPAPSLEDISMTRALSACADIVGVPLIDHVIVAARGGGSASLHAMGLLDREETAA